MMPGTEIKDDDDSGLSVDKRVFVVPGFAGGTNSEPALAIDGAHCCFGAVARLRLLSEDDDDRLKLGADIGDTVGIEVEFIAGGKWQQATARIISQG